MPKAFPKEFRRDVIAVARKREGSLVQVAKDFGVSTTCLHRWLSIADVEDGVRTGSRSLRQLRIVKSKNGIGCWNKKSRF